MYLLHLVLIMVLNALNDSLNNTIHYIPFTNNINHNATKNTNEESNSVLISYNVTNLNTLCLIQIHFDVQYAPSSFEVYLIQTTNTNKEEFKNMKLNLVQKKRNQKIFELLLEFVESESKEHLESFSLEPFDIYILNTKMKEHLKELLNKNKNKIEIETYSLDNFEVYKGLFIKQTNSTNLNYSELAELNIENVYNGVSHTETLNSPLCHETDLLKTNNNYKHLERIFSGNINNSINFIEGVELEKELDYTLDDPSFRNNDLRYYIGVCSKANKEELNLLEYKYTQYINSLKDLTTYKLNTENNSDLSTSSIKSETMSNNLSAHTKIPKSSQKERMDVSKLFQIKTSNKDKEFNNTNNPKVQYTPKNKDNLQTNYEYNNRTNTQLIRPSNEFISPNKVVKQNTDFQKRKFSVLTPNNTNKRLKGNNYKQNKYDSPGLTNIIESASMSDSFIEVSDDYDGFELLDNKKKVKKEVKDGKGIKKQNDDLKTNGSENTFMIILLIVCSILVIIGISFFIRAYIKRN
eukprot:GAHX01003692.1.p1 GENE.GAHX01003692.1~~GAHX01003692.1.p1  ORF type:complete len:522 (-),score=108.19 GAHX01003692.1:17-1582(-)